MLGLITLLGILTFLILVMGFGVFAGGAIVLLLAKLIIPVFVLFAAIKLIGKFFESLGGRC